MAEDNRIPDQPGNDRPEPQPASAPPAEARRRRRRWPYILVILLLLLGLLAALLPTIASTGMARSMVLSWLNGRLNGQVQVKDWSLGWRGGTHLTGLSVWQEGARILEVQQLDTQASFADLVRADFTQLGTTRVQGLEFLLKVGPDGQTNFQKLIEPLVNKDQKKSEPFRVAGDFDVQMRGRIEHQAANAPLRVVTIEPSTVRAAVPGLNEVIDHNINLVARVDDKPAGRLLAVGKAKLLHQDRFDVARVSVDDTLETQSLDLAGLAPFLPADGSIRELGGISNGRFRIRLAGATPAEVQGSLRVANFTLGGGLLAGDVYRTPELAVDVPLTRYDSATGRVHIGQVAATAPAAPATQPANAALVVRTHDALLQVSGDATPESLRRLADNQAPGAPGRLSLQLTAELPSFFNQLPRLLHVRKGVKVERGRLTQVATLSLAPDRAILDQQTAVTELSGRDEKNQRLSLRPIEVRARAISLGGGGAIPDLRDLVLNITSGFARFEAKGDSISAVAGEGNGNLEEARRELGQFIDFGGVDMAGEATFRLAANGDLIAPNGTAKLTANVVATGFRLTGLSDRAIQQSRVEISANGTLHRAACHFLAGISGATLDIQSPLARIGLANGVIRMVNADGQPLTGLNVLENGQLTATVNDLTEVQSWLEATGLLPAPTADAPTLRLAGGSLTAQAGVQRQPQGLAFTLENISGEKIILAQGKQVLPPRDLALKGSGLVAPPSANGEWQVRIPQLTGSFGPDRIAIEEPLVLGVNQQNWTAAGAMRISGPVRSAAEFARVLGGSAEREWDSWTGNYAVTQRLAMQEHRVILRGQLEVRDLAMAWDAGKRKLTEPRVLLANELALDPKAQAVWIESLAFSLPDSGTVAATLRGGIEGYADRRALKDMELRLSYDAAKLLDRASAFMTPEQRQSLEGVKIAGVVKDRVFRIGGSVPQTMPATAPAASPLEYVTASGTLWLDSMEFEGMATEKGLELPIEISRGRLRTIYADKPKGEQLGTPTPFSGGRLRLNGLDIVVIGPHLRATSLTPNLRMLENVRVTPQFVNRFLGSMHPIFSATKQARGALSLTIQELNRLPLDTAVEATPGEQPGRAKFSLSLVNLDLSSPMLQLLASQAKDLNLKLNRDGTVRCNVRNAQFEVRNGRVYSDLPITIGGHDFGFQDGEINLADKRIVALKMMVPKSILPEVREQKLVKDQIPVPVTGTTSQPRFNILAAVGGSISPAGVLDTLKDELLGGDKKDRPEPRRPQREPAREPARPPRRDTKDDPPPGVIGRPVPPADRERR